MQNSLSYIPLVVIIAPHGHIQYFVSETAIFCRFRAS
ncbi:hypothetical protein SPHINGOR109_50895 [Sphingorhabdus sp. 109]|nr:hypothetical protein SPHINGOR109_50895 [Sphingorhabdus sp. 109]